jgi:hypothetical protein
LLHLLRVGLLQVLGLLLVLLLQLLGPHGISLLFRQLLMFLILLLLEFLPILILRRDYLVLLLLVFLIQLGVPCIRGCGAFDRRHFFGMGRRSGASGGRDWRRSMVRGKALLRVILG